MKKSIKYILSTVVIIGFLSSCGKTTKNKIEGEWTITAHEESYYYSDGDITSTLISSNSITENNDGDISTGDVHRAHWKINKDGTWEREISYTMTSTDAIGTVTVKKSTTVLTGEWDFLNHPGKEFKKNEQIVFYPIKESYTTRVKSTLAGETLYDITSTSDYDYGETSDYSEARYFKVYTSTKNELVLGYKGKGQTKLSNGTFHTYDVTNEYTLKK
ncbi:MAG: hypothetical protein WC994_06030 [Brumimicrobium sp.]